MERIFPRKEYEGIYKKIIKQNLRREKKNLSRWASLSSSAQRRRDEEIPDKENLRPAFFHDTDRIIFCSAYARYRDKTQVFGQTKNDHITRRVLHVQMVSKISRTLARFLKANEDLTEAIALGHDLGHAPFGHAGEDVLSEILEEYGAGSFAHNAQSVRILEILENGGKGLNLSLQTLDGILGHNGEITVRELKYDPNNLNWETLDKNTARCFKDRRKNRPEKSILPSTLEGCIVRVSDIISYLGRDLEDAVSMGLIKSTEELPSKVIRTLGANNKDIIDNLVMDILHNSYNKDKLVFSETVYDAMTELLRHNYEKIYKSDSVSQQEEKFKRIVRELFKIYLDDLNKENITSSIYQDFLLQMDQHYKDNTSPARIVSDYLSGMTDDFLIDQYSNIFLPAKIGYFLKG
ncbi:MAG: HD domain-containing protein [Firmicutes bacterium]|nr:HD domain-containing protein [Bacillota bacterium]